MATKMTKLILTLASCVALLFAFVGCASRDTYYDYGQTTFVSLAGSNSIGEVMFSSSGTSVVDIFVKMPSGKVKKFKDIIRKDIEKECYEGGNGRADCSIGAFEFTFVHDVLKNAYCRNHFKCEFSFARSEDGPFITFPMSVRQVRETFGQPQKVTSNPTKLR